MMLPFFIDIAHNLVRLGGHLYLFLRRHIKRRNAHHLGAPRVKSFRILETVIVSKKEAL